MRMRHGFQIVIEKLQTQQIDTRNFRLCNRALPGKSRRLALKGNHQDDPVEHLSCAIFGRWLRSASGSGMLFSTLRANHGPSRNCKHCDYTTLVVTKQRVCLIIGIRLHWSTLPRLLTFCRVLGNAQDRQRQSNQF